MKICVFSAFLNADNVPQHLISMGNAFHRRGPTTRKDRSPKLASFVRGILSKCYIYYVIMSITVTLLYHGRPSLNNPRISVVDCGAPPRLAHATVMNGSTTYLEAAAYSCEEGYRFGGTADPQHVVTFICDGQGEWIGANISCEGGA